MYWLKLVLQLIAVIALVSAVFIGVQYIDGHKPVTVLKDSSIKPFPVFHNSFICYPIRDYFQCKDVKNVNGGF